MACLMYHLTIEIAFRKYVKSVLDHDLSDSDVEAALTMVRYPRSRLLYPSLGCFHTTTPENAWVRVIVYCQLGIKASHKRCPCCNSIVGDNFSQHNNCLLWKDNSTPRNKWWKRCVPNTKCTTGNITE